MKNKALTLVFIAALGALLAACGGGGGDDGESPASADAIDKYMGTLTFNCYSSAGVVDASTGAQIYERYVLTYPNKVSATKATGSTKVSYFNTSDCSGTARHTLTLSTSDNYLEVTGSKALGAQTADKVKFGTGVYFPGISAGTSLIVNGLKFTGSPYNRQSPLVGLTLLFLDTNGDLFEGDYGKPLDSDGYPTALGSAPVAKKS
jgi:hypothetical protein